MRRGNNASSRKISIASGVSFHSLGHDAFIFSERRQEIYHLNNVAAIIWCLVERKLSASEIAMNLSEAFHMGAQEANCHVNSTLDALTRIQLINVGDISTITPDVDSPSDEVLNKSDNITYQGGETFCSEKFYSLLKSIFRIRYPSMRIEDQIHPAFCHLSVSNTFSDSLEVKPSETIFQINRSSDGSFYLCRDNVVIESDISADEIAPLLKRKMMKRAVKQSGSYFVVHAGVVQKRGHCLVLSAPSGSGKSTLVAGLIAAGFKYLSDEVALFSEEINLTSVPLSLCLKQTGWPTVQELFSTWNSLQSHYCIYHGQAVRYLPPPSSARVDPGEQIPVRWVVFPSYKPEGTTRLRPLATSDGIRLLFSEAALPNKLTSHRLERLLVGLRNLQYYSLEVSSLRAAVNLLNNLQTAEKAFM